MTKRTKSHKSPSRKAHKAKRKAARKASPKQLAARARFAAMARAGSFHKSSKPVKARKARSSKRRGRRGGKGRSITKHVASVAGHRVAVYKVRRGGVHHWKARRHSGRKVRVVRVNPAKGITLLGGITEFVPNVKGMMGGGIKGYAFAAAGMGGAIFAGTLMARITTPLVANFAPGFVANPIGARLLGAANYYLTGWLLSRFIPGVDDRTRRAIMAGGTIAALAEAVSPGMLRSQLAKLPVLGPVFGDQLQGLADGVSGYVATSLHGVGESHREDAAPAQISGYTALHGLADGYEDQMVNAGIADDGTP